MTGRNNKVRLLQIVQWLKKEFPTSHPVTFRFAKKIAASADATPMQKRTGNWGEASLVGRKIIVRIVVRKGVLRSQSIETLLHEWAHAVTFKSAKLEAQRPDLGYHDKEWALKFGQIYRKFIDEGGAEESKKY